MEGVMLAALSGAVNSGPWRGHWDLWTLRSARQRDANASRQTSVESSPQARTMNVARPRRSWAGSVEWSAEPEARADPVDKL